MATVKQENLCLLLHSAGAHVCVPLYFVYFPLYCVCVPIYCVCVSIYAHILCMCAHILCICAYILCVCAYIFIVYLCLYIYCVPVPRCGHRLIPGFQCGSLFVAYIPSRMSGGIW